MDSRQHKLNLRLLFCLVLFQWASPFGSLLCPAAANSTAVVDSPNEQQQQQQQQQITAPIAATILSRLDAIQESLKTLTIKYNELHDAVLVGGQVCPPLQPSHQREFGGNMNNRFTRDNAKGEQQQLNTKDLFHFNKLATDSNSIPSSSSPWTPRGESNALNDWSVGNGNSMLDDQQREFNYSHTMSDQKRLILSIGQHYESMFGFALDNLSSMLKEQLAAFRLILAKLMNRIVDHSYQNNMIANQLSIIKDECSLAASCSPGQANSQASASSSTTSAVFGGGSGMTSAQQTPVAQQVNTIFRSSDITMLVRLLSQELDHTVMNVAAQMKASGQLEPSEWRSETTMLNETKSQLTSKLDEISSVVKQSALLLTKLSSSSNAASSIGGQSAREGGGQTASQFNIMTFTNSDETENAASQAQGSTRRWFPGSKVPGRPNSRTESDQNQQQRQRAEPTTTSTRRGENWCQTKTSQIKPSSCQQLRLAGANCTGQYYVFVRGFRHVYCDMNMDSEDDGGGWTVIMRRIDKSLVQRGNTSATNFSIDQSNNPQQQERNNRSQTKATTTTNQLLELFKASQVNFDLDWQNYRSGFGHLDGWSEFFVGLDLLHQLTTGPDNLAGLSNETELQIDLETSESNKLHLRFSKFSVANEDKQYELSVGNCNSSSDPLLCDAVNNLNGAKFYTFDKLANLTTKTSAKEETNNSTSATNKRESCESDRTNLANFGWWLPSGGQGADERAVSLVNAREIWARKSAGVLALTRPIGRLAQLKVAPANCSNGDNLEHLYWPNWPAHSNEPLRKVVLKIRRRRLPGVTPQLA